MECLIARRQVISDGIDDQPQELIFLRISIFKLRVLLQAQFKLGVSNGGREDVSSNCVQS